MRAKRGKRPRLSNVRPGGGCLIVLVVPPRFYIHCCSRSVPSNLTIYQTKVPRALAAALHTQLGVLVFLLFFSYITEHNVQRWRAWREPAFLLFFPRGLRRLPGDHVRKDEHPGQQVHPVLLHEGLRGFLLPGFGVARHLLRRVGVPENISLLLGLVSLTLV
jgi:hypothetical protein